MEAQLFAVPMEAPPRRPPPPHLGTHDETLFAPSKSTPRGNQTSVSRLCLQGCTKAATTTYSYDETGHVTQITDPNNNLTKFFYTDSFTTLSGSQNGTYTPPNGNTNAYLTKITNALTQTENFTYDYNNGQLTILKDQNGQSTSYVYNDPFARPTLVTRPDGGTTTTTYNDAPYNPSTPSPSVSTSTLASPSPTYTTLTAFDGLGHTVRSEITSDPDCASGDRTDTVYYGTGKPYTVSNPYCSTGDPTYGLTTYTYDGLGRTLKVSHPDSTSIVTTYKGRATEVQDEGNGNGTQQVTRISQIDALGRLISVCEISNSNLAGPSGTPLADCGLDITPDKGFLTTYLYDSLDDLISVTQGTLASAPSATIH